MKNFGHDFKYAVYILLAFILAIPVYFYATHLLLHLVALSLMVLGLRQLHQYKKLSKWETVQGKILQTEIGKYSVSSGSYSRPNEYYFPLVNFTFRYKNNDYQSNRYGFDHKSIWSLNLEEVENTISKLNSYQDVKVYINPKIPEQSVLNINVSKNRHSHSYALIAAGILLNIVGVVVWIYS